MAAVLSTIQASIPSLRLIEQIVDQYKNEDLSLMVIEIFNKYYCIAAKLETGEIKGFLKRSDSRWSSCSLKQNQMFAILKEKITSMHCYCLDRVLNFQAIPYEASYQKIKTFSAFKSGEVPSESDVNEAFSPDEESLEISAQKFDISSKFIPADKILLLNKTIFNKINEFLTSPDFNPPDSRTFNSYSKEELGGSLTRIIGGLHLKIFFNSRNQKIKIANSLIKKKLASQYVFITPDPSSLISTFLEKQAKYIYTSGFVKIDNEWSLSKIKMKPFAQIRDSQNFHHIKNFYWQTEPLSPKIGKRLSNENVLMVTQRVFDLVREEIHLIKSVSNEEFTNTLLRVLSEERESAASSEIKEVHFELNFLDD